MKFLKIAGISTLVLIALAVLGVTFAFAQQPTPTTPSWWNSMRSLMQGNNPTGSGMMGNGSGMMGRNGQSMLNMHNQMTQNGGMGAMHEWMHQSGGVHETVWNAMAEQLGLTSEELTAQVNNGKTLSQIAEEKGVSTQNLAATMEAGMKGGLVQAVEAGELTQEQADLMLSHMAGQYEWMLNNMGSGMMGSGSGMMGRGSGGCHGTQAPDGDDL